LGAYVINIINQAFVNSFLNPNNRFMNKSTLNRKAKRIISFIKNKRIEKNYSQEAVAKHLKMNQATYSRLENGRCCINLEQLVKVLELYDIELDKILNGSEF
jgi:DNA-binding XRE family transcriptional regulator